LNLLVNRKIFFLKKKLKIPTHTTLHLLSREVEEGCRWIDCRLLGRIGCRWIGCRWIGCRLLGRVG
jgi:hypothetical protein